MSMPKPKSGIMDIHPYVGGEGRVNANVEPVRLASNENPLGCSDLAKKAYQTAMDDLHRYPDGGASALRLALSKKYDIPVDNIVCGTGSDELISLLVRGFAGVGDEVIYSKHGFLMYPIQTRAAGAIPVAAPENNLRTDVDAILAAVTHRTKMVFIANPNNPTGSYLTKAEVKKLHSGLPAHVLLVVDAAYAEFPNDSEYEDGKALVDQYNNVVMLRTFSKIHGLAALRVGWGYFPTEVAGVLNRIRGVFNVNVPAQLAAVAALSDDDFMQRTIDMTTMGRAQLIDGLQGMGLTVYPSVGNFILVNFGKNAEEIRLFLKDRSIFIRQMGAYQLPDCLRITIGREEDNAKLLSALKEMPLTLLG